MIKRQCDTQRNERLVIFSLKLVNGRVKVIIRCQCSRRVEQRDQVEISTGWAKKVSQRSLHITSST